MRQALVLTALGLILQTVTADAQTVPYGDRSAPLAAQMPARINVGMNITQRVTSSSIEEQRRVEQVMRRRLYEMAMEECTLLVDVFGAECRVTSLNVNSNIQNNGDIPIINSSMNGQYEIVPRR